MVGNLRPGDTLAVLPVLHRHRNPLPSVRIAQPGPILPGLPGKGFIRTPDRLPRPEDRQKRLEPWQVFWCDVHGGGESYIGKSTNQSFPAVSTNPIFSPSLTPPFRVGVIAPASAPRDATSLPAGLSGLEQAGLVVVRGRDDYEPVGYLAGTDQERLDELHAMMARQDVDAIVCVRGGYGVLRILDQIDFDLLARAPKLLVGYSDITALQLALFKHTGLVSISGPMVAVEWPDPNGISCRHFLDLVSSSWKPGPLDPDQQQRTMIPGSAEGVLLGGNLSLITRLIGTRHMPDMRGTLLFLEEIGETPYRVDGLLAHLQMSGILDEVAGIILGGFTEADVAPGKSSLTMEQVFEDWFSDLGIPVAYDLRYGHFPDKVAVPIGVKARLEANPDGSAVLSLLQKPTR